VHWQTAVLCLLTFHMNIYSPSVESIRDFAQAAGFAAVQRCLRFLVLYFCLVFGRPFVKRFALCYRSVVCPILSLTFVHSGQTVGRIKMKLGTQVGLGPGHIALDGDPAPPPQRGRAPTEFSAHFYCGQTAACIKMPLGTEISLSPGDVVLNGDPAGPPPKFSAHVYYSYYC